MVIQKCEHYFCRGCITLQIQIGGRCPMDNANITLTSITKPVRLFMNIHSSLQIKCQFEGSGCKVVTNLGNLAKHEASCEYSPEQCPNAGCKEQVLRRDLQAHSATTCNWRIETCQHGCGGSFPFVERGAHEETCPKKVVKCPGKTYFITFTHVCLYIH